MPAHIDVEGVANANRKVNIDEYRRGEDALKALRESGTVKRSDYGLGTPESVRHIRPTTDEVEHPDCLPSFRKLR